MTPLDDYETWAASLVGAAPPVQHPVDLDELVRRADALTAPAFSQYRRARTRRR
ncbi:MAG TPA: hypothetical protein VFA70_02110 [Dehalococcoidia bacterium]|nr:hypothetical protein [Dehalococcoidia bacterium]